jgi:hypothetical protein
VIDTLFLSYFAFLESYSKSLSVDFLFTNTFKMLVIIYPKHIQGPRCAFNCGQQQFSSILIHTTRDEKDRGEGGGEMVGALGVSDVSSGIKCHGCELRVRDVSLVVKCHVSEPRVGHACSGMDFLTCNSKHQKRTLKAE